MGVLGLIQVGMVLLKIAGISKLNWIQTFIPMYIGIVLWILVFVIFTIANIKIASKKKNRQ
ncbi:hypothetical protein [Peptostreptococcus sp. D1]|uniref:hypothetical protein n=1 Tax=Peptostreptococcus sp. D1 TaxID=72304 RepID=UPI0008ECAB09|nr:hypothetical protein [Peptostreptococcus sp. D1]SFE88075.1 hypothetical protein SAMN02910278_01951 [Peptostreptococcus sp. D1]